METAFIKKVWFDEENIFVQLNSNKVARVPLCQYPRMHKATSQQRNQFEVWDNGKWLHWEELDEDLSANSFLEFLDQKDKG